jgi:Domain of unknown function (DUF4265)
MWAKDIGDGRYVVENIPWFVRGIACNDIVSVNRDPEDGHRIFAAVLERGGHSVFRAALTGDADKYAAALTQIIELGCDIERRDNGTFAAIDVPPAVDADKVAKILSAYEDDDVLEYDEGLVHWKS